MNIKRLVSALLGIMMLSSCGSGSLAVRADGPDRVEVILNSEEFPQHMTILREKSADEYDTYYRGDLSERFPRNGRLTLPRDFALFERAETDRSFDPSCFPKGKYLLQFYLNAEHGYSRSFEIK